MESVNIPTALQLIDLDCVEQAETVDKEKVFIITQEQLDIIMEARTMLVNLANEGFSKKIHFEVLDKIQDERYSHLHFKPKELC